MKIIFDSPSLPSSTDGSITSLPRAEIEQLGHAHQQMFFGLHGIGMVCASKDAEPLRLRCFTLHDNAMCSVCLILSALTFFFLVCYEGENICFQ